MAIAEADFDREQELFSRNRRHGNSIKKVDTLAIDDVLCRFAICEGASADMIGTIEAALIKWKQPLWNSFLDGFGNHDPAKGRYEQARSDWDVVHSGREWAERCKGETPTRTTVLKGVESLLSSAGN